MKVLIPWKLGSCFQPYLSSRLDCWCLSVVSSSGSMIFSKHLQEKTFFNGNAHLIGYRRLRFLLQTQNIFGLKSTVWKETRTHNCSFWLFLVHVIRPVIAKFAKRSWQNPIHSCRAVVASLLPHLNCLTTVVNFIFRWRKRFSKWTKR